MSTPSSSLSLKQSSDLKHFKEITSLDDNTATSILRKHHFNVTEAIKDFIHTLKTTNSKNRKRKADVSIVDDNKEEEASSPSSSSSLSSSSSSSSSMSSRLRSKSAQNDGSSSSSSLSSSSSSSSSAAAAEKEETAEHEAEGFVLYSDEKALNDGITKYDFGRWLSAYITDNPKQIVELAEKLNNGIYDKKQMKTVCSYLKNRCSFNMRMQRGVSDKEEDLGSAAATFYEAITLAANRYPWMAALLDPVYICLSFPDGVEPAGFTGVGGPLRTAAGIAARVAAYLPEIGGSLPLKLVHADRYNLFVTTSTTRAGVFVDAVIGNCSATGLAVPDCSVIVSSAACLETNAKAN